MKIFDKILERANHQAASAWTRHASEKCRASKTVAEHASATYQQVARWTQAEGHDYCVVVDFSVGPEIWFNTPRPWSAYNKAQALANTEGKVAHLFSGENFDNYTHVYHPVSN